MYETKMDTSAVPWSPTGWPGADVFLAHGHYRGKQFNLAVVSASVATSLGELFE